MRLVVAGCKPRPTWGSNPPPPAQIGYDFNQSNPITVSYGGLPPGAVVQKVVLMRPGSTSHHSDFDQRYVELPTQSAGASQVRFWAPRAHPGTPGLPPDSLTAPAGYYMTFLVSNDGIPSVARFVELK